LSGSAPKYTGKNVINPMAAIGAVMMMLDTLGEQKASVAVETAMVGVMQQMKSMSAGKMGYSTTEIGDMVAKAVS
jgi:3-isopropylmalate dehydrogenase